jgi:hypothetical protein
VTPVGRWQTGLPLGVDDAILRREVPRADFSVIRFWGGGIPVAARHVTC